MSMANCLWKLVLCLVFDHFSLPNCIHNLNMERMNEDEWSKPKYLWQNVCKMTSTWRQTVISDRKNATKKWKVQPENKKCKFLNRWRKELRTLRTTEKAVKTFLTICAAKKSWKFEAVKTNPKRTSTSAQLAATAVLKASKNSRFD